MLIQFSVENFRSFRDQQVFSMVASPSREIPGNVYTGSNAPSVPNLLTVSALYGPNASGKTNLIKAMSTVRNMVIDSVKYDSSREPLPVKHFKLDDAMASKPSTFEVFFTSDNVKYQYGFSATSKRIYSEWLYAFPKKARQKWFERFYDPTSDVEFIEIGNNLTSKSGRKEILISSTKAYSLLLSTAALLNEDKIKPVYDWFIKQFRILSKSTMTGQYTCSLCDEDDYSRKQVLKFLQSADLPVADVIIEKKDFDIDELPSELPESFRKALAEQLENEQLIGPRLSHTALNGKSVLFDFDEESDGTRRIFELSGPIIDVLKHGRTIVVDELHDSLHPKLVEYIVGLFSSKKTNPLGAQLIFTTHETSILDQNLLRRDQFWFCDKNEFLETVLYSLTEFSPRKGRENIEKSYLSGRYGAIPFISQNVPFQEEE